MLLSLRKSGLTSLFEADPLLRFVLFLFGLFWSGRSSPSRRSLGFLLCCCTASEGERRETRLPPFRIIIIATLGFPGLRPGTMTRRVPCTQYSAESSWPPYSPPAVSQNVTPNEEWGEPDRHASATLFWVGPRNPVLSFSLREAHVSARQIQSRFTSTSKRPIP